MKHLSLVLLALVTQLWGGLLSSAGTVTETHSNVLVLTDANFDDTIRVRAFGR